MATLQECIDDFKNKITRESFSAAGEAYMRLRYGAKYRYKDVLRVAREKYPDLEESEFDELLESMTDV